MSDSRSRTERELRTAAYLLILGLAIEAITLQWAHPTSFVVFLTIGAVLVLAGMAVYLFAIVRH